MPDLILTETGIYKELAGRENSGLKEILLGNLHTMNKDLNALLQNIKLHYPEYTDHSIQHSYRLLQYLSMLLGSEGLRKLSINELFCLTAAAMFHDAGMAVEELNGGNAGRENHGVRSAEVAADYFRTSFAGLDESARYGSIVAFACKGHCMDRKDLSQDEQFSRRELISFDRISSKRLAILLRIGDLLDLGESRTNSYVLSRFRERFSAESLLHHVKHMNLSSFLVSEHEIVIRVRVRCIEEYEICESWFDMLKKEIEFANGQLKDEGFSFPIPETIIDTGSENVITTERLRFEIDDRGAIWDIISQSIYTAKLDFLRELIQNAIDATLAKAYCDTDITIRHPSPRSWGPENCQDVLVAYSAQQKQLYISDSGIGMTDQDLSRFLFKITGSGYQSMNHRSFRFPAIARFGIGFVSCLAHASHIGIFTRKISTATTHKVSLTRDSNSVLLQKLSSISPEGTTIILTLMNRLPTAEIKKYIQTHFCYPNVDVTFVDIDRMNTINDRLELPDQRAALLDRPYEIRKICQNAKVSLDKVKMPFKQLEEQLGALEDQTELVIRRLRDGYYANKKQGLPKNYRSFLQDVFSLTSLAAQPQLSTACPLQAPDPDPDNFYGEQEVCRSQLEDYLDTVRIAHQKNQKDLLLYDSFAHTNAAEKPVSFHFDWNYYAVLLDHTLSAEDVLISKTPIDLSGKNGLLFVRLSKTDHDSGVEYDALAGFCFSKNEIYDSLVGVLDSQFLWEPVGSHGLIKSIEDEFFWAQEERYLMSEDDYEVPEEQFRNLHVDCNQIKIRNNQFYHARQISPQDINLDYFTLSDWKEFARGQLQDAFDFNPSNLAVIEKLAEFERIAYISESRYYQDGIAVQADLGSLMTVGWFRIYCNCTGDARMRLNITRHRASELADDVAMWMTACGKELQREILNGVKAAVANCKLNCRLEQFVPIADQPASVLAEAFRRTFHGNLK